MKNGPLSGIRAVTCSTAQAGTVPYMLMADMGAEIIKIELPKKGDGGRKAGEVIGEVSSFFETNNRGVKSITLNLKSDEGKEILYKLIKTADVFGQNFAPGAAERNGFGYETLKKINPALVYASVSAYGPSGPSTNLPGTDAIGQAIGGVTEAFAVPGQQRRTGIASVADETCGLLTLSGVLAAVLHAKNTGQGQKVETSLIGSAFRLMGWTMTTAMWRDTPPITGIRINGTRERAGIAACFNDSEGKPFAFQLEPDHWKPTLELLGFYETLKSKNLEDLGLAFESDEKKDKIISALSELFSTNKRDYWIEKMRNERRIAAPVNSMIEASNDPDIIANNYVTDVYYPEINKTLKVHGTPWKFSETPAIIGKAPKLGADNHGILKEIGYSEEDIKKFEQKEII
ncbi:MAG: CoA transferase [Chloroflexi bacterium]|nr:CoA transferase [Chloroflexota bacterium]|tara:strand:+ start:27777 stop:28982 length:1206 start_codon:yes stop_codon:yes gene_type:complete